MRVVRVPRYTQSSASVKCALHCEVNSSDWIQNYSERWMRVYIVHTKVRHAIAAIKFWRFEAYLAEITLTLFVVAVYPSLAWPAVSCIEIPYGVS